MSSPRQNRKKSTPSSEKVSTCTNSVGILRMPGPTRQPPSTKPRIGGKPKKPAKMMAPKTAKQNTIKMSWIRRASDAKEVLSKLAASVQTCDNFQFGWEQKFMNYYVNHD